MKGFWKNTAMLVAGALGVALVCCQVTVGQALPPLAAPPVTSCKQLTGHNNVDLYDPCWMQRYGSLAHREVNRAMAPQVLNGHVLDQTVWNHHFEAGSSRLTAGGLAHLQYLSRRRPEVDRTVYIATALDLQYDPNCPERYAGARQELDSLRAAAVQKYLVSLNAGRCQDFQILVHDPADPSIGNVQLPGQLVTGVPGATYQMYLRFRGGLPGTGAAGPSGSGTGR